LQIVDNVQTTIDNSAILAIVCRVVIARSASDAAIHEYHGAPPWIATAFGLAMTGDTPIAGTSIITGE
jgi:hypothetical protein